MGLLDGRRILLIGDSLSVAGFGPALEAGLAAEGAAVLRDAKAGRSARWFYADDGTLDAGRLPELVQSIDPTDVVIALGTNDSGFGPEDGVKWWTRFIEDVRAGSSALPRFVWVMPPAFDPAAGGGKLAANVERLREALPGLFDAVVDSQPLTADLLIEGRTTDRIHFTQAGGRAWAERALPELVAALHVEAPATGSGSSGNGLKIGLGIAVAAFLLYRVRLSMLKDSQS